MKNALLRSLVRLLRPHKKSHVKRTFLIVSTTGLGDTLFGTPALRALKIAAPECFVVVLTSPLGKAVLQNNPHIDELIAISDPVLFSLPSLYRSLKKKKITDILIFHTSQRPILPMLCLLGAKNIIGIQGENKGLDNLLSICLPRTEIHEIQKRLRLVEAAGLNLENRPMEVFLPEETFPELFQAQGPIICIHPGTQDLYKEWTESHFIALGKKLLEKGGTPTLYITGTTRERGKVERIAREIPGAIPLFSLSLAALATLLRKTDLFIVGDTGPMHLGVALKTPTVALFGPTNPALCGPFLPQGKVVVLAKEKTCTPCLRKKCREPFCLLQIGVDAVYDAAKEIL